MYRCTLGTSLGSFSDKKIATISARETNRTKKSMSTTAQTYWQSSAEIWEGQHNYSLKNEVDKDAISCFSIRKDWRFAVRAKSFALHWRSRGFFRGHVRSCEKGLCSTIDRRTFGCMRSCVSVRCTDAATFDGDQCSSRFHLPFFSLWLSSFFPSLMFKNSLQLWCFFGVGGSAFTHPSLARTDSLCAAFKRERERDWYAA